MILNQNPISLRELNSMVADVVNTTFDHPFWIVAELSEVRTASNGHCYIEFIDKLPKSNGIAARARGVVWAQRWNMLRIAFEQATGQVFTVGLKVLVQVQVRMHELYGYSLEVLDINPSYTLGELERQRAEIIAQLTQAGIIDMNRELPFPLLPQRIAVISAANAAGYGDFTNQLANSGYCFYTHLFEAAVQGAKVEESIIEALDRIYHHIELFDVVVIIRGGGASADLKCFDSYAIAENCTQFPIPIIVGIGHERDSTILDRVAHTSVKTPTAAAAFLINHLKVQDEAIEDLRQEVIFATRSYIDKRQERLNHLMEAIPQLAQNGLHKQFYLLEHIATKIKQGKFKLMDEQSKLSYVQQTLSLLTHQRIATEQQRLKYLEQTTQMANPIKLLQRGFSIVRVNGKAIKKAQDVKPGDIVQTQTSQGTFEARVIED